MSAQNRTQPLNVEKGKQGFQETTKQAATSPAGLGTSDVGTPEYATPFAADGYPLSGAREYLVNEAGSLEAEQVRAYLPHLSDDALSAHIGQIINAPDNDALHECATDAINENMAHAREQGIKGINPDYAEPTEKVEADNSYGTTTGCKYDPKAEVTETAKAIRADLKAAQKSGFLPDNVKFSVTTEKGSGYRGLHATILAPGRFDDAVPEGYGRGDGWSAYAENQTRVAMIVDQYKSTRVARGYHEGGGANFYSGISTSFADA